MSQMQWVPINLDKQRRLRFDTNAFCMLEEITGKSFEEVASKAGITEIRAMLYCGLYWDNHDLTLEATGEIIDAVMREDRLEELSEAIGKAADLAMGTTSKKAISKKKKKRHR